MPPTKDRKIWKPRDSNAKLFKAHTRRSIQNLDQVQCTVKSTTLTLSGFTHVAWWRTIHSHGYQVLASKQHQPKHPLLFSLWCFAALWFDPSELVAVSKDHIHVLIESQESSYENPAVL